MTGSAKRLFMVFLGMLGSLLAWAAMELFLQLNGSAYMRMTLLQGLLAGGLPGMVLGMTDEIAFRQPGRALLRALSGFILGGLSGMAAVLLAGRLYVFSSVLPDRGLSAGSLLIRGVSWALAGVGIGLSAGYRRGEPARILWGLLGGMAGGFAGGLAIELSLSLVPGESLARAFGLLLMGIFLGFFLGIAEKRSAFARLRVLTGPLRNREYLLSGRVVTLGPGMRTRFFLPGDEKDKGSMEISIERNGEDMYFRCTLPSQINERAVEGVHLLRYRDVIKTGSTRLLFLHP